MLAGHQQQVRRLVVLGQGLCADHAVQVHLGLQAVLGDGVLQQGAVVGVVATAHHVQVSRLAGLGQQGDHLNQVFDAFVRHHAAHGEQLQCLARGGHGARRTGRLGKQGKARRNGRHHAAALGRQALGDVLLQVAQVKGRVGHHVVKLGQQGQLGIPTGAVISGHRVVFEKQLGRRDAMKIRHLAPRQLEQSAQVGVVNGVAHQQQVLAGVGDRAAEQVGQGANGLFERRGPLGKELAGVALLDEVQGQGQAVVAHGVADVDVGGGDMDLHAPTTPSWAKRAW